MLRNILGAIAGYIAMVVVVIAGLYLAWKVLGPEGSFDGQGPYPSAAWTGSSVLFGFAAAFLAGRIALKVGRAIKAVHILVALMLALGLWGALTAESSYQKRVEAAAIDKQVADLSFMEAGQVAKSPTWYVWTIPLIGAAGALLGGRQR